jgi:hypothetical protein
MEGIKLHRGVRGPGAYDKVKGDAFRIEACPVKGSLERVHIGERGKGRYVFLPGSSHRAATPSTTLSSVGLSALLLSPGPFVFFRVRIGGRPFAGLKGFRSTGKKA